MRLSNCKAHGNRAPRGSTYIGRPMTGLRGSRLANPFGADIDNPLEKYRRRLCRQVIQGFFELDELKALRSTSVLACWCVERDAALVRGGLALPEMLCHGDIVFTVWMTAVDLGWSKVPRVDFSEDFAAANRAWSDFYEACYHQKMLWGGDAAQAFQLETKGAA